MEQQDKAKIKQPPVRFSKTQALVGDLSTLLGGPVLAYWNSTRGSVCDNDVVALYEIMGKVGRHDTLYLFIKSSGGNGQSSLRLVSLLRQHCRRVVALIPLECASAATMIALGSDEICMGPMGYLTAVDTSLYHQLSPLDRDNDRVSVSLDELTRVIRLWQEQQTASAGNPYDALFHYVHPLVIGAVDRAESLSIMLCQELLAHHIADPALAASIANTLNAKYPSHNYPILLPEARKLGLNVAHLLPEANALLLALNERYSEMGQKAVTDFDEIRAHSNEILNIWEAPDIQVFFQEDRDLFYRAEEKRWITLNDNSGWHRVERARGKLRRSRLHIA